MVMWVAMPKQSLWISSLTYLEIDGLQSFLNKISFKISIFAMFDTCSQEFEVMDVCCAFIDDFNWLLENERYDFFLNIVSAAFEPDASALDNWINNWEWLSIDIIDKNFDKPFCGIVCQIYSGCAEKRERNRIKSN